MSDSGRARPIVWRDVATLLLTALVCAGGVWATQPSANLVATKVKETSEVYLLPPPGQLEVMTLGYRSATADVLWADALVVQGLRLQERRRYSNVVPLIEAVIALDPTFRDPYLMTDTLVTFQPVAAPVEDVRMVRRVLELGTKNRPLDAEIWLVLGQYTAFIAPNSYLKDPDEQERWRNEGLPYLERAVELAGPQSNIAWLALGGGRFYREAGARDAAIRFYQKVLSTTDDEELKRDVVEKIDLLVAQEQKSGPEERHEILAEAIRQRSEEARAFASLQPDYSRLRTSAFTGLPRTAMLAMGPSFDAAACAGGADSAHAREPRCAHTWADWAMRTLAERRGKLPTTPSH